MYPGQIREIAFVRRCNKEKERHIACLSFLFYTVAKGARKMTVKVYTSKNCGPCHEIVELIKEGQFQGEEEVELVDIETDEGFAKFTKAVLAHGDGAVPTAYKDGKKCNIRVTEDNMLVFECPTDGPPA